MKHNDTRWKSAQDGADVVSCLPKAHCQCIVSKNGVDVVCVKRHQTFIDEFVVHTGIKHGESRPTRVHDGSRDVGCSRRGCDETAFFKETPSLWVE